MCYISYKLKLMELQVQTKTNSLPKQSLPAYSELLEKTIKTFPIYYKIFEKYYSEGKDVSGDLNRVYLSLFGGLVEYYTEFMTEGIGQIIQQVEERFKPEKPYALIDYIEYLFGNVLYETFLHELKKLNLSGEKITYSHLCIIEYIVRVELIKYKLYLSTIGKIIESDSKSKLLVAMECRVNNCVKKISYSIGWLERYFPTNPDVINHIKQVVEDFDYDIKDKIDMDLANKINSFMEIYKK